MAVSWRHGHLFVWRSSVVLYLFCLEFVLALALRLMVTSATLYWYIKPAGEALRSHYAFLVYEISRALVFR